MYLTKRYKNIQKLESAERLFRQSGTGEVFKAVPNLGVDGVLLSVYHVQSDSDMRSGQLVEPSWLCHEIFYTTLCQQNLCVKAEPVTIGKCSKVRAYVCPILLTFAYIYVPVSGLKHQSWYRCISSKCDRLGFLCGDSTYFCDRVDSTQSVHCLNVIYLWLI